MKDIFDFLREPRFTAGAVVIPALLLGSQANAALYIFEFKAITGFVTSNENAIFPGLIQGQEISGMFSYEDTPNVNQAGVGSYRPNTGEISLQIGSTLLSSSSPGSVSVFDNARGGFDRIVRTAPLDGSIWQAGSLEIELRDFSRQALDGIELPKQINLDDFMDTRVVRLQGTHIETDSQVDLRFTLNSITLIPEPSVSGLFALASGAFLLRRRRHAHKGASPSRHLAL